MNSDVPVEASAGARVDGGRMGPRLAVLGLAIGLAAVNTGNNLLYLILALVLGLAFTSTAASQWSLRRLTIVPHLPEEVVCGEPFYARVEVGGRFPFLSQTWVDVRIEGLPRPVDFAVAVPSAEGRGLASSRVTLDRRGLFGNLSVTAATGYPLDLSIHRISRALPLTLAVLPRYEKLSALRIRGEGSAGTQAAPRHRRGVGFELHDIREYTAADDARLIDWRSSARARRLMVREFELERDRRIDLVLDHESPDEREFERVIESCAAILDLARRKALDVRLIIPGQEAALTGRAAMRHLAGARAVAPGRGPEPSRNAARRARSGADLIVISAVPGRSTPIEVA